MKAPLVFSSSQLSISVCGLILGVSLAGNASAAFISCVGTNPIYDISSKVSTATACTILSPLNGAINDSVNPPASSYTVNTEAFFGITNWLFDGKWDGLGSSSQDTSSYFNFTGGAQSGTYTYAGAANALSDIMFVFKNGGDTNLVGYKLPAGNGTYSTPFTEPPFTFPGNNAKEISHISVYYRLNNGGGPPQQVPEPGVLLLMGAGLLGFGMARRRKYA